MRTTSNQSTPRDPLAGAAVQMVSIVTVAVVVLACTWTPGARMGA